MTLNARGFTLIELLISMILMLIILGAIGIVFNSSTDATNIGEARIRVYDQARKALERLQQDLLGCLNFNEGRQAFVLENGYSGSPGANPTYGTLGTWQSHVERGADRIRFRSVTSAGDTTQQVEVTYELKPYNDPTRVKTARSNRPLFVLVRNLRGPHPTVPKFFTEPVSDSTGVNLQEEELVHFVTVFNIEYYADNGRFSQIDPSPCGPTDPLGDMTGANDATGAGYRIPYIRVTLTIVDDAGERQERTISRTLWIPTGN